MSFNCVKLGHKSEKRGTYEIERKRGFSREEREGHANRNDTGDTHEAREGLNTREAQDQAPEWR